MTDHDVKPEQIARVPERIRRALELVESLEQIRNIRELTHALA